MYVSCQIYEWVVADRISRGDVQFDGGLVWLLAPNQTETTSYLDGHGPQPKRFARVLGSGAGNASFIEEYMVG